MFSCQDRDLFEAFSPLNEGTVEVVRSLSSGYGNEHVTTLLPFIPLALFLLAWPLLLCFVTVALGILSSIGIKGVIRLSLLGKKA